LWGKKVERHGKLKLPHNSLKPMSNSTLLYGQLMSYLRQHSRYCDLRHLKALGWMVSALICSGQLNLAAWEHVPTRAQSPKHRAAVAEIHEQRPDSSRSPVSAVSDGGFERVATKRVYLALGRSSGIDVTYRSSAADERFLLWRVLSTIARQLPSASTKDTAKSALATAPSDVMLTGGLPIMT